MATHQQRNLKAASVESEALESLQHMTVGAQQTAAATADARPDRPAPSKLGRLVDDFALGAAAFHPGYHSFVPPQEIVSAQPEPEAVRPSRLFRAAQAIGGAAARVWRGYRRSREVARATALLAEMDDRALRDIGLTRADIGRAARYGRDWDHWR